MMESFSFMPDSNMPRGQVEGDLETDQPYSCLDPEDSIEMMGPYIKSQNSKDPPVPKSVSDF